MNLTYQTALRPIADRFVRAAISATVTGARWLPSFRDRVLQHLSETLNSSYVETEEDAELLALDLWFGQALKPFFIRLLNERPRAAKKLLHLAYIWARDVRSRTSAAKGGVVTPVTVVIEPTSRCNLACPGCYSKSTRKGEDLPYEVWRDVIVQCREMGVTLVTVSGGEPFLRESEDRIITRLAAEFQNLGFLVYTNATMINDEIAKRLGEVGNVFPAISVEGGAKETDARRGEGYASGAKRVRELLAKNEVMFGFSATVMRHNAHLLSSDEFIDERIKEGDMFGWYFLLQPIGRTPDLDLLPTAEQRAHLRDQILKWRLEGRPIFLGDFWNDGPFVGGCIAGGRYYFHIYANGDISPCVFAPVACGNVLDIRSGKGEYRTLAEFVNRHPHFVQFREKQRSISDRRAPCLLFDHPEKFREICAETKWFPAKNMPDGYLDGEIARALDACSQQWREALQRIPPLPPNVRQVVDNIRAKIRRPGAEATPISSDMRRTANPALQEKLQSS